MVLWLWTLRSLSSQGLLGSDLNYALALRSWFLQSLSTISRLSVFLLCLCSGFRFNAAPSDLSEPLKLNRGTPIFNFLPWTFVWLRLVPSCPKPILTAESLVTKQQIWYYLSTAFLLPRSCNNHSYCIVAKFLARWSPKPQNGSSGLPSKTRHSAHVTCSIGPLHESHPLSHNDGVTSDYCGTIHESHPLSHNDEVTSDSVLRGHSRITSSRSQRCTN